MKQNRSIAVLFLAPVTFLPPHSLLDALALPLRVLSVVDARTVSVSIHLPVALRRPMTEGWRRGSSGQGGLHRSHVQLLQREELAT